MTYNDSITDRARSIRDEAPVPGGWDDVVRRAEAPAAKPHGFRPPRGPRRHALGGAAAIAASAVVVAALFVSGLGRDDQAATTEPRSVRYTLVQEFTQPGRSDADPAVLTSRRGEYRHETVIDFTRQLRRSVSTAPGWAEGIVDYSLIMTGGYGFVFVPERDRQVSGGKTWLRFPDEREQRDRDGDLSPRQFTSPLDVGDAAFVVVGEEIRDGRPTTHHRRTLDVDGTTMQEDVWVDERGWLVQRTMKQPSGITSEALTDTLTVLAYDEPVEIVEPVEGDWMDVPDLSAATERLRVAQSSRP